MLLVICMLYVYGYSVFNLINHCEGLYSDTLNVGAVKNFSIQDESVSGAQHAVVITVVIVVLYSNIHVQRLACSSSYSYSSSSNVI
jgi:hypothetical protein